MNKEYFNPLHIQPVYNAINGFFEENDKGINEIAHYTSTQVLDSLLNKATFWASNIFFMNDKNEFKLGTIKINEIMKGKINQLTAEDLGLFTISFSNGTDLLQQWITYAKESGVSIEFDNNLLLNDSPFIFEASCAEPGFDMKDVLHLMLYDNEIKKTKKDIIKYFNDAIKAENPEIKNPWRNSKVKIAKEGYLRLLASYIKDRGFIVEKEIRASFFPGKNGVNYSEIKYYPKSAGILRPYMEVTVKADIKKPGEFKECLPIKSITIGPSGNQQAVFDSVVHRVKYGEKKVYNYYEYKREDFNNNFVDFFWEGIKRAVDDTSKHVDCQTIEAVYETVSKALEEELKAFPCTDKWTKPTIDIEKAIKDQKIPSIIDRGSSISADDLVAHINKNNYFTKEGIWIKKSKIPYIF